MFHLVSRAEQSPSAGIWHPENCGSEALDFSLDHESLDENWLVVSTQFEKYARQIGSFPQVGVKVKNI